MYCVECGEEEEEGDDADDRRDGKPLSILFLPLRFVAALLLILGDDDDDDDDDDDGNPLSTLLLSILPFITFAATAALLLSVLRL